MGNVNSVFFFFLSTLRIVFFSPPSDLHPAIIQSCPIAKLRPTHMLILKLLFSLSQALAQPLFFTASAPLTGSHVNTSPKGLPSATFTIFSPNSAAYIDATGSGSETVSHIYENGRVTIMFCSFEASPRILRFFCWGKVTEWDDESRFEEMIGKMGKTRVAGARAVIDLKVWKVCRAFISLICFRVRVLLLWAGTAAKKRAQRMSWKLTEMTKQ